MSGSTAIMIGNLTPNSKPIVPPSNRSKIIKSAFGGCAVVGSFAYSFVSSAFNAATYVPLTIGGCIVGAVGGGMSKAQELEIKRARKTYHETVKSTLSDNEAGLKKNSKKYS